MRSTTLISVAALLAAGTVWGSEPISPIPPAKVADPAKVELGKKLFFDPRLSRSGFISCNSCHNLSTGGSDNLAASVGDRWQKGGINSPTVLNSSMNVAQFWDGRAKDLREQAGGPIANPAEMASNHGLAVTTFVATDSRATPSASRRSSGHGRRATVQARAYSSAAASSLIRFSLAGAAG